MQDLGTSNPQLNPGDTPGQGPLPPLCEAVEQPTAPALQSLEPEEPNVAFPAVSVNTDPEVFQAAILALNPPPLIITPEDEFQDNCELNAQSAEP